MTHSFHRQVNDRRKSLSVFLVSLTFFALGVLFLAHEALPDTSDDTEMSQIHTIRNPSVLSTHNAISPRRLGSWQADMLQEFPSDGTNRAIFYNIFVPPERDTTSNENDDGVKNALDIVREQLDVKSSSKYAKGSQVHYTLIGHNSTSQIQSICGNHCHLTQYAEKGDESLTLQSLWEYCRENPESHVTYIHNKGSFHPNDKNTRFRRMLTKSAFSDECQTIVTSSNDDSQQPQCNACSARFSPLPHWHMPGNMWTTQCSYVRNLHPPRKFESIMKQMVDDVNRNADSSVPRPSPFMIRTEYLVGLGRYSMEHWLGSHPYLRPCDVYGDHKYRTGYIYLPKNNGPWTPTLQQAPWSSLDSYFPYFSSKSDKSRHWYCGQARLLEFTLLYDKIPPTGSFFWSYYSAASSDYCPKALDTTQPQESV